MALEHPYDDDPTLEVSEDYLIMVTLLINWHEPRDEEHTCRACGNRPTEDIPLATLIAYSRPEDGYLNKVAKGNSSLQADAKARRFLRETMAEQLRGEFHPTLEHVYCWACMASKLTHLIGFDKALNMLMRATLCTRDEEQQYTQPFHTVVFTVGEHHFGGHAGLIGVDTNIVPLDLPQLLREGAKHVTQDDFDER